MTFEDQSAATEFDADMKAAEAAREAAGRAALVDPFGNPRRLGVCKIAVLADQPVDALDAYATHPHQRNTTGRAGLAGRTYLSVLQEQHREIDVVHVKETGARYLLNGHTRKAVWAGNLMPDPTQKPETVNITVWEADTEEDAIGAYFLFDAVEASKSAKDEVYGAMREENMEPTSYQFINGSWLDLGLRTIAALHVGELQALGRGGFDLNAALRNHRDAIMAMDALGFGEKVVVVEKGRKTTKSNTRLTPVQASALLAILIRDGDEAVPFLEAVRDKTGVAKGDAMSMPHVVNSWPKSHSRRLEAVKHSGGSGDAMRQADWEVVLNAYTEWRSSPEAMMTKYPFGLKANEKVVLTFLA